MTRKEQIEMLRDEYEDCVSDGSYTQEWLETLIAAREALEQEPVLNKVRAEIEQLPTTKCTETCRIYIDAYDFKKNILAILDKYKAESEGE